MYCRDRNLRLFVRIEIFVDNLRVFIDGFSSEILYLFVFVWVYVKDFIMLEFFGKLEWVLLVLLNVESLKYGGFGDIKI